MEKFECAFCGEAEFNQTFSAFDFDQSTESFELRQCIQCELAQTWPSPEESALDQYYSRSYYGDGAKKFSALVEYLTILSCKFRAKKINTSLKGTGQRKCGIKVLDIGCGRANLLGELSKSGIDCYGVEREKFPSGGNLTAISIHHGSLEERHYDDSFFDAVVIWHVLEHLYQPASILNEVARITHDKGLVVIAVPNFSSLQSRLFKANWFHLDLPRHLFHFNGDNLEHALSQRGYTVQSNNTCSLEQNVFGFIQSSMNSFRIFGKANTFYQLLKQHSGVASKIKLAFWSLLALLILPFALLEFAISCIFNKGASIVIFARKTDYQANGSIE